MSERSEIYKEKLALLVKQEEIVDDLVDALAGAADRLKNYWDMQPLPDRTGNEMNPQSFANPARVEAEKWPSSQEFIAAVVLWRDARTEADQAWDGLSEEEKEQNPLPELPSDRPKPMRRSFAPRPKRPKRARRQNRRMTRPYRR